MCAYISFSRKEPQKLMNSKDMTEYAAHLTLDDLDKVTGGMGSDPSSDELAEIDYYIRLFKSEGRSKEDLINDYFAQARSQTLEEYERMVILINERWDLAA